MSTHYTTEPPPTASVLLHTTAGPLTISLFAQQTPLTCRNFLQHCLDGTYDASLFHRVVPGFVIQTGDPTSSGEGGASIYEDREFERYDADWAKVLGRDVGEKIAFTDEIHSRLRFNRRGLVGMAKSDGGYGSQFFVTLGDVRQQLDGKCTMFGRVEGEGIYNVVRIAEGELVEGTERPMYPEKITKVEILEMPRGDAWANMRRREKIAQRTVEEPVKKKAPKKKAGKTLLSFGDDEDEAAVPVRPKKAKFNPNLIDAATVVEDARPANGTAKSNPRPHRSPSPRPSVPLKRKAPSPPASNSLSRTPSPKHTRKPSFPESTTQLPLRNEESPSRSPSPAPRPPAFRKGPDTNSLKAEIDALKASMRRGPAVVPESKKPKSALEAMIPSTSTRGRKRPRPGESNAQDDANALKLLNAFRARLEKSDTGADSTPVAKAKTARDGGGGGSGGGLGSDKRPAPVEIDGDNEAGIDDEANLCDLHFIANCQSCSKWDGDGDGDEGARKDGNVDDDDDADDAHWMTHTLSFAKDRLGKDLNWKKRNEEDLVVIDPREREREIKEQRRGRDRDKGKGKEKEKARPEKGTGRW